MYLPIADRMGNYIGYVDLDAPTDLGDTLWSRVDNVNMKAKIGNTTSIFGILQTLNAFTPTSACVKQVRLSIVGV